MSAKLNVDIVAQLKDFNKAMSDLKSQVNDMGSNIESNNKKSVESTKKMSGAFAEVGKTMAGLFAVDQLVNLGKKILDTTVEFQKMEAVLTTALGSNSAAQSAMDQIVNFASSTPFQVNELTDAFVKLANRGFIPTMDQMRQLGDLASSVGKSFDQLTEAILDAQSGEFERLKEFGIKASQQGDVVQFTFKGITTEVEKSDKAIQAYLLGLGDLEGVAGSMEAISKTTGGVISNLEDNITQLFKNIGDSSSGFINWFVKDLNNVVSSLRNMGEIMELMNPFKTLAESSDEARTYLLKVNDSTDDLTRTIKDAASEFDNLSLSFLISGEGQTKFLNEMIRLGNTVEDSKALYTTYVKLRKEQAKSEQELAGATATTTAATQKNPAEV
jgi:phage tail tape-measure protein